MGFFRWLKNLFGHAEKGGPTRSEEKPVPQKIDTAPGVTVTPPPPAEPSPVTEGAANPDPVRSTPAERTEVKEIEGWKGRLILSGQDLIQMARNLQARGEFHRAELLLRDGAKESAENLEYWRLLFEIEEPLNRKGRAYFCIEQILRLDENTEWAQQRQDELKKLIDTDLSYFIEYKLAPEFYRLK